ncbi:sigma-70 family RNA polymerase sigma factor [Actinomadura oligospora]|uniref:sigma-70 family RNA polymerase sigma factor n=1 Tax=Actinomadura oligospora TaxID=111804 RepID=UPI00047A4575|nr:sigma-70 family RNA polymerase sigma factor [Actinomadura oligospora]
MNDRLLVEALRARDLGAPAAVYDAYAERLFAYCWMRLRERDAARVAARDAFVVAEAQIERLSDPELFGPWLYAITRLECDRREPDQERAPDLPVASHDQDDVDQRLLAWRAVLALTRRQRELLDLHVRHGLAVEGIARVTRTPAKRIEEELDLAAIDLETALVAEILVDQGPFACAERGWLLRARRGELTPVLREQLVLHADECEGCAAFKPRAVSAAKVFRLLPWAPLPDDLRERVLGSFLDAELVGYRLFIATRVTDYTAEGFPIWPHRSVFARRLARRRGTSDSTASALTESRSHTRAGRLAAAAVAALMVLAGGTLAAFMALTGQVGRGVHAIADGVVPHPTVLAPRDLKANGRSGRDSSGSNDAIPVSVTYPLGVAGLGPSPVVPARARQFQFGGAPDSNGPYGRVPAPPGQRPLPGIPPGAPPTEGSSPSAPQSSPTPPQSTSTVPTSPPASESPPPSSPSPTGSEPSPRPTAS